MSPEISAPWAGETLPGMAAETPELRERLASALAAEPAPYVPRTRHRRDDGSPRFLNRLLLEASPYLRQHAHNPVAWYPWGDEAFQTARDSGRPVLLSVGYSTCHWCHVMEEESFEDEEIAAYINRHFVPIKVDREERPDVDGVYMACVQAWTGHGGWPMTVVMTPDRRPFFGGTYYPARDGDRGPHPGFLTILKELHRVYKEQPERVHEAGRQITDAISERLAKGQAASTPPGVAVLDRAMAYYERAFDDDAGGIGGAPKFPSSLPIRFLLRQHLRAGGNGLRMAALTLARMAQGGLHDQIGGGFHRYCVDGVWLVPHFEKMLYDNALLTVAYLEGAQAAGRPEFAAVAATTLDYLLREMAAPAGGFYAATDADSPNPERGAGSEAREEGWFFTWTPAELDDVLGADEGKIAAAVFGVTAAGNFEGRSVLHRPHPIATVAAQLGLAPEVLSERIAALKARLYDARSRRPPPLRDDKILAGWNGLALSALAKGAQTLRQPRLLEATSRTARFLATALVEDGHLRRLGRSNSTNAGLGFLEDYAFVIQGLLDAYEADFAPVHLRTAIALAADAETLFADADEGGYFLAAKIHDAPLVREKPTDDGAVPSGNSVMAMNLLRLATLTGAARYREQAERTLKAFGGLLGRAPWAMSEMLNAVDFQTAGPRQILLVAPEDLSEVAPFLDQLAGAFVPHRVLAATTAAALPEASALIPLLQGKIAAGRRPTAYICEGTVCRLPVQDRVAFAAQLPSPTRQKG